MPDLFCSCRINSQLILTTCTVNEFMKSLHLYGHLGQYRSYVGFEGKAQAIQVSMTKVWPQLQRFRSWVTPQHPKLVRLKRKLFLLTKFTRIHIEALPVFYKKYTFLPCSPKSYHLVNAYFLFEKPLREANLH